MEGLLKSIVSRFFNEEAALVYTCIGMVLLCLSGWWLSESIAFLILPFALFVLAVYLYDLKLGFYLTGSSIILSTNLEFSSIGLAFPGELSMLLLTALGLVYILTNISTIDARLIKNPISVLLLCHLAWIFITSFSAEYPLYSFKFFAAKIWFVVPFYFLGFLIINKPERFYSYIKYLSVPLFLVLCWTLYRHSTTGFSFEDVNRAMSPFFSNHVNYAALTTILFPFLVYGFLTKQNNLKWRVFLGLTALMTLIAIQTSFTRAAYVSLLLGVGYIFVLRLKLTKHVLISGVIVAIGLVSFLIKDNNYLNFAPDYNKAITHTDFSNLLEATYKLEDISTMERVYRWVAGGYMIEERPILGWGAGNFYPNYKGYAIEKFKTYVSGNPERSGIHNYLMMILLEQGYPGLLIFIGLIVFSLLTLQKAYSNASNQEEKLIITVLAISLIINISFQLINDLLESDKSGPWFFYCLGIIASIESRFFKKLG